MARIISSIAKVMKEGTCSMPSPSTGGGPVAAGVITRRGPVVDPAEPRRVRLPISASARNLVKGGCVCNYCNMCMDGLFTITDIDNIHGKCAVPVAHLHAGAVNAAGGAIPGNESTEPK